MSYAVKEIFYTLQGEGAQSGRPSVFCRFAGCNLWSGREEDRAAAICKFCDTDFFGVDGSGGGKFESAATLARAAYHLVNRHVALQICQGWLRYCHDHVLDDMLRGLGLAVTVEQAPFEPEAGAYHADADGAHGHSHAHGHGH